MGSEQIYLRQYKKKHLMKLVDESYFNIQQIKMNKWQAKRTILLVEKCRKAGNVCFVEINTFLIIQRKVFTSTSACDCDIECSFEI